MGGFGIFLATTKAAGGAKYEFETQNIFFFYLKIRQAESGKELQH